jgi:hypothetical protein
MTLSILAHTIQYFGNLCKILSLLILRVWRIYFFFYRPTLFRLSVLRSNIIVIRLRLKKFMWLRCVKFSGKNMLSR